MRKKLMMLFAAAAAFGAWAATETVGGYTWTYQINGDTAEIYNDYYIAAISPSPTGAVTIPSTLGGKPVMSIGNYAFYGCSGLTSVRIPDSVTSIGDEAFYGCSGLVSVTIGNGVTSIGDSAFRGCSGLTSVTIPNSVTSIGDSAFSFCTNVTDVVVPGWKCTIPFDAVTNLVISEGTTSINDGGRPSFCAFSGCSGLTSVTIPNCVTNIGSYAFYGCSGLTSVTIPDGVTRIGGSAFYNCSGLTSVTIPDSVTSIGESAFYGCTNLTSVTIPDSVTIIGAKAFYNCSGLTNVTIGNGVTTIGVSAFYGCSGLTGVTIGNSVAIIMSSAFYNCSGLASVTMPDSVTSIGDYAFYNCSMLDSVTIPATVRHIGDGAFAGTPYDATIQAKMSKIVAESSESDDKGYSLVDGSRAAEDRTIASVAVDGDCAIDDFVLKDGVVYDSVLRIVNTAPNEVKVTLPSGYVYETIGTASPLVLPASSKSLLTITRTADRTFLVTRQTLNVIQ